ncbi:Maf-like protein [soil metagenome]
MPEIKLVLGSKSPRRKYILDQAGFKFEVLTKEVEEVYPPETPVRDVPVYLAKLKAEAIAADAPADAVVITSDTIVLLDGVIYGKPTGRADAVRILQLLSGNMHEVITGVCLAQGDRSLTFSETTKVYFDVLTVEEIEWYVDNYEVMDKAGAYAVQEGIGLIGITGMDGDYFNVMGLPMNRLYRELQVFVEE